MRLLVPDTEEALRLAHRVDQNTDLARGVVDRERGPHRRCDAVTAVQRPSAMVTDSYCNAGIVQNLPDVVGVHPVNHEGDRSTTIGGVGRTDDPDARQRRSWWS